MNFPPTYRVKNTYNHHDVIVQKLTNTESKKTIRQLYTLGEKSF